MENFYIFKFAVLHFTFKKGYITSRINRHQKTNIQQMRKHKSLYLFFLLWLCYIKKSYSQFSPFTLDVEQFTTEEGLSAFNIRDIFKDNYGFIWVATSNSLSRYDGYDFLHYNNSNPVDSLGLSLIHI